MINKEKLCGYVNGAAYIIRPNLYRIDVETSRMLEGIDDLFMVSVYNNLEEKDFDTFQENMIKLLEGVRKEDVEGIEESTCMMENAEHAYIGIPIALGIEDDEDGVIDAEIIEETEK